MKRYILQKCILHQCHPRSAFTRSSKQSTLSSVPIVVVILKDSAATWYTVHGQSYVDFFATACFRSLNSSFQRFQIHRLLTAMAVPTTTIQEIRTHHGMTSMACPER
uniref:Uncharacterized protein n=1 Tax=Arundo donax TaxID=35708 RepID=A0A0A9E688_ARUDO